MRCKRHLKYKPRKKPKGDCKECWLIWEAKQRQRRALAEFFGIDKDEQKKKSG